VQHERDGEPLHVIVIVVDETVPEALVSTLDRLNSNIARLGLPWISLISHELTDIAAE
jgi:hypothetical protein